MSARYNYKGRKAIKCGLKLNGKAVYRYPVTVTNGERAAVLQDADGYVKGELVVLAHTAADAANYVANVLMAGRACTEVEVWGPKGGLGAHRYNGFEKAVWQEMCADRPQGEQLGLFSRDALADASMQSKAAIGRWNDQLRAVLRQIRRAA